MCFSGNNVSVFGQRQDSGAWPELFVEYILPFVLLGNVESLDLPFDCTSHAAVFFIR
jgi:hypothetical protein